MLLRIEDIDTTRCRPDYEQAIYEDLAWLGITWEKPVRRQSEHLLLYREAIEHLTREGLIYPAFESRADIARLVAETEKSGSWPRDPDGAPLYVGMGKHLTADERERKSLLVRPMPYGSPWTGLLHAPARYRGRRRAGPNGETGHVPARPEQWGDVILARRDTPTSYHLSVVIDDALQGVTHVVRGQDLFWATGVHRLLQQLLGLPQPVYRHHGLVLDDAGQKLSKSTQSTALRELRAGGMTPDEVRGLVGIRPTMA
jgi:glutamyl-Q tRNA(Asp) synthetase